MDRQADGRRSEMSAVSSVGPLDRSAPVYIAGHRGLVGSALLRRFSDEGFGNLLVRSRSELDLTDRAATFDFVLETRPAVVIDAAARVGGILANSTYPADFLSENLQIQVNLLDAALAARVPRLLFLGSSCIYPKLSPQPIPESALLTGPLEPTNDAYAIAKIAGILQVQAVRRQHGLPWISAMPTNLYGPGDNFSPAGSHLLPALIRRYDEAKANGAPEVTNWGTGTPRRELLHVDDLAGACLYLLEHFDGPTHVNVGTGVDHTIREIADMVAAAVGYDGETRWDSTKPDGTPRKLLDVSVLREAGWRPAISLREGIEATVAWYRENAAAIRT
uniref:GDP-L-fucose synthase n=2 Tax=Mycobacterium riyadhense TaxID=486698 RepID=A0A653EKX5_9MYCO|nr:GDP-L-fucose synthase [Mycobacterium riyadhense]